MKKILITIFTALLFSLFIITSPKISAVTITSAPYDTYSMGPDQKLVLTQTAYEPAGLLNLAYKLNSPEDFYMQDDTLYIADTGNKRIIKTDLIGNSEIVVSDLLEPTGVHVDQDNKLYVVDKSLKKILIYDESYNLINEITKPTEPIFGLNSPFVPLKITTGPRGIMYVTGEGSVSGVMQFNYRGEFLGYLGTNPTNVSFYRKVLEFFNQSLAKVTPLSPLNVAVDEKGSLYTISKTESMPLKKFNIASSIVLSPMQYEQPEAVYVNNFGNIYTISRNGIIQEFDSSGNLLFLFGGSNSSNDVLGLFSNPTDIITDSDHNIYVLDKGNNTIQILARSEFTKLVHHGLVSLNDGKYNVAEWEDVLRANSVFALANSVIARTYFRTGDYKNALDYYQIAGDKAGYSDTFWQIRNNYLQTQLGIILSVLLIIVVLYYSLKFVDHKYQIYDPIRKGREKIYSVKTIKELRLGFNVFRHPLNTFHEIKHEAKSSNLTAIILYLTFIVLNIVSVYTTGFLFNDTNLNTYNVLTSFLSLAGIVILFVFANYLIATLSNGEGWFKDVFIGTAYVLVPYIVLTIPIIILSNVLTLNEIFIFQAILAFRDGWTLILLVLMVMEIHNYEFKELIKNLLLTIFTMAIIVAILLLIYLLVNQMYEYIVGIIKEVINRATH